MKTAIYIEDGIIQLVLTPEGDFEKNALRSFQDKPTETEIFHGEFYDCRGGWTRQKAHYPQGISNHTDNSLIMRIKPTKE